MNEFGYILKGKVFRKGFLTYPDREIGEVKDTEEMSLVYFTGKFTLLENKVHELLKTIQEAVNKGSHLAAVQHTKSTLHEYDGIGDFEKLHALLETAEAELVELVAKNKMKNLEIKSAILQEADALKNSEDWKKTTERLTELKNNWIKTGAAPKEADKELNDAFAETISFFFDRRRSYYDELNKAYDMAVAVAQELVKEAEELAGKATEEEAGRLGALLIEKWKANSRIPKVKNDELWPLFKASLDKLKTLSRNNKSGYGPAKAWKLICEETEALLKNYDDAAIKKLKVLRDEWAKNGNADPMNKKKFTSRFLTAGEMVDDLDFAVKSTRRRTGMFDAKPEAQRWDLVKKSLHFFIKKGEDELEVMKSNLDNLNFSAAAGDTSKTLFDKKLSTHLRRIENKRKLVALLEDKIRNL